MSTSRSDKLLAAALRLATKALAERASAEDLHDLALTVLELDEAIVVDGQSPPKRWTAARSTPRARRV
jgi:hypothetical protein